MSELKPARHSFCGISTVASNRVMGGYNVHPGIFPWVAVVSIEGIGLKTFCAGTLISKTHVLTAAHCLSITSTSGEKVPLESLHILVALGESDFINRSPEQGIQQFYVTRIVQHPQYNPDIDLKTKAPSPYNIILFHAIFFYSI